MHPRIHQKNITAYLSRALLAVAFFVAPHSVFALSLNDIDAVTREASKGFMSAFTLPLNFLTTSAADYAHFTTEVGQTITQNVTNAAHSSADLYRGVFTYTSALTNNTLASAAALSRATVTTASDTLTSLSNSARSITPNLALNTQNQTASIYGAVNEFWTDFLHTVFGPTETVTTTLTPGIPTLPQAPTSPQITATPPPAPTSITRITQPVIERTIERTSVLSGITATDLESQISSLRNELLNEIAKGKATAVQDNNALYLAMAPMNRINNLSSVTISNPTITGASITSGTLSGSFSGSVAGTTGSFDTLGIGTTTPSDTFAVNGVTYLADVSAPAVTTNRLYNNGGNLYWGATVIGGSVGSWTLTGSDVSYSTGNVGIGTTTPYATLSVVGTSVLGTVTGGIWNGTAINDTYLNLGTGAGQLSAADMLITDTGSYFTGITGNTNAILQHLGQEVGERWSSGVVSGGTIATSTGNTVNIAAGVGYIGSTRITWNASNGVAMTANGDNWISIDSTGAVVIHNTEPSIDNYIRLGYVYTTASNTVIGLAASAPSFAGNYESRNNNFVTKGIGAVVQSGNIVGTTATPLNIQATSGVINSNLKEFTVADVSTFTKWYNSADNGWVTDTANNLVTTTKYNATGNNQASALVTMTASYWKKDLILRTLDGNLHYIFGQAEYATEQAAKDGALPSIPTAITNGGSAYLATAVVQNGDAALTNRLYDIRPNMARVFGFGTSGTTGSIATHSALSGLGADDHTQYLLASGARNMAGALNMGTNAITGAMSITMAGLLQNTLTTEQMRLRYDATHYSSFTVGADGALTIGTTGTGTTTLTNGVNVGSGEGYWVGGVSAVSRASGGATSFGFSNTVSSSGLALGNSNTSSNIFSNAIGTSNNASVGGAVAVGNSNTVSGYYSAAVGGSNTASGATFFGSPSSAFGYGNVASNEGTSAFGRGNTASGAYSSAFGYTNTASASGASAFGSGVNNNVANSLQIGPSNTAKMAILSSGNVGIGTTSPYAALSVVGEIVGSYFTATSTTATSTFYGGLSVVSKTAAARLSASLQSADGSGLLRERFTAIGEGAYINNLGYTSGEKSTYGISGNNTVVGANSGITGGAVYVDNNTIVGAGSTATGSGRSTTIVGASNTATGGVTIGSGLTNSSGGVLIGVSGGISGGGSSSIGTMTSAQHADAVALGWGTASAAAYELVYGSRSTAAVAPLFTLMGATTQYNGRNMFQLATSWVDVTDATRKARNTFSVYDTAIREYMRADSTGSGVTTQFLGGNVGIGTTSPYAKLSVVGNVVADSFNATSTTAVSTIANILGVGSTTQSLTSPMNVFQFANDKGVRIFGAGANSDDYLDIYLNTSSIPIIAGFKDGGATETFFLNGAAVGSNKDFSWGDSQQFSGKYVSVSDSFSFQVDNQAKTIATFDTNNAFGIGTTTPSTTTFGNSLLAVDISQLGAGLSNSIGGLTIIASTTGNGYTGNYLALKDSTGSLKFSVNQYGNVNAYYGIISSGTGGGTAPANGAFVSNASASVNGFTFKGAASQTGDMIRGLSSTNLGLFTVGPTGNTAIGTSTTPFKLGIQAAYGATDGIFDIASTTSAAYATTSIFRVNTNGNVGIGTAAPAKSLQVIGDIRVGTSGTNGCVENFAGTALTGTCSSDASLKTNIQPLGSVLSGLVQLTPSTFYWNDVAGNELHNSTTTQNYGLIAQDVVRVLPSMVATTSNGYLGVNYSMLPILTLQGLKELDLNLEGLASTTTAMTDVAGERTFAGRFFDRMTGWLADTANGIGEFFANRVHTKTLCVGDKETGETCITKDQLDALLFEKTTSNNTSATVNTSATTTPIIISINGNNPATIDVGETYGDLGALITSPESAKNFGIKASLDGGPALDISQITLDTSVAGSHTIVYSVTDQNNATTTAERIVNVVAPTPIVAEEPIETIANSTPSTNEVTATTPAQ